MTIKYFKIEKLIRDKIPVLLQAKGIVVNARIMEKQEFISRLKDKLVEESKESLEAENSDELCEELADVLEVVHALSESCGLTMQQIEQKRLEKKEIKGGFENKIFNSSIDVEDNNQSISYYLNKPHQYPEIHSKVHHSDCLFCQIARQEKEVKFFANFTHCYVIKDRFPVFNGHILIIPHEHTENWFTAKEEVRLDILKALQLMKEQLDLDYSPHGYNIGANCGEIAGQSVMHLHLHLIPRYRGDMEDPKGGVRGVIPSKQKY
jgi:diadenosine tetraphosphate (Ap4A) HIT family hydrolase/predicted house-cleaning noncanonical NTP pyrophosphatase (MazG superfamily)